MVCIFVLFFEFISLKSKKRNLMLWGHKEFPTERQFHHMTLPITMTNTAFFTNQPFLARLTNRRWTSPVCVPVEICGRQKWSFLTGMVKDVTYHEVLSIRAVHRSLWTKQGSINEKWDMSAMGQHLGQGSTGHTAQFGLIRTYSTGPLVERSVDLWCSS